MIYFCFLLSWMIASSSSAATTHLRVAILENLTFERLSTDKYAADYLDGIDAAVLEAKKRGYQLTIEKFFYDKEPLAIFKTIPIVEGWQPDLVIAPRSSNFFLMLRDHFKDTLVISPFATANGVAEMPNNFYSMTLPNSYFTQAAVNLVLDKFPGKSVAPIIEIDCKNCVDFADEFSRIASDHGIVMRDRQNFLSKNSETVGLSSLLSKVAGDDILLIPNTSYASGAMIPRLADHLKRPELIVIGGDGWGDWSSSYVGKVRSSYLYAGYRLTPWSFDLKDSVLTRFKQSFRETHRREPTGIASLMAYNALSSVINTLPDQGLKEHVYKRKAILATFLKRVQTTPHYGRPARYGIYKVTQDGEIFIGDVSALHRMKP